MMPAMARVKSEPDTVYVLEDECGRIRYVGVTADASKRLGRHIRESRRSDTHRATWIRSIVAAGSVPTLRVVETGVRDWAEAEVRWIAKCRNDGCDLVNGNDGGHCVPARMRLGKPNYPYARYFMRVVGGYVNVIASGERKGHLEPGATDRFRAKLDRIHAGMRRHRKMGRMDMVEQKFKALADRKGWVVRG